MKDLLILWGQMFLVLVAIVGGMTLAQHFDYHDAARAGVPHSTT